MTAPSIDAVSGLVEELRAHAGFVENGGCVEHSLTDEASLSRRAADALEAQARELAEARGLLAKQYGVKIGRAVCLVSADGESVTDIYDIPAERMPNGYDYAEELAAAEARITALESDAREKDEANAVLVKAVRAVTDATGSYLPPDGISKDELISRVLEATDNPKINSVMMGGRNGTP